MNIEKKSVVSPKGDITLYTLTNNSGASVTLSSLGAGIVSVVVPDKDGKMADVALGYANPVDYIGDGPCAGKTPADMPTVLQKANSRLAIKSTSLRSITNRTPCTADRKAL